VSYQTAASGWHDFYILAGTASATLVGLLFVALFMVIPEDRSTAAIELIATGVASLVIATPSLLAAFQSQGRTLKMERRDRARLILRFGLSAASYLAIIVAGFLLFSSYGAFTWLVVAVVVLLIVSLRNTWDLLVTVGDVTLGRD
jgi:hypothetical protein